MAILNGFLRGAHDPEITANIDNKQYSGVATEMYNFIGTKRGALSKRAPFVLRDGVPIGTYFIPYVYDQDQRYLLMFSENPETGKAQYRFLNYWNGVLSYSTIGTQSAVIQPEFTSDSQDGYVCSQSKTVDGFQAYQRINEYKPMTLSQASNYWIGLQFPTTAILSKLEITNKKSWSQTIVRPTGGFTTRYYYNTINFVVEGSTDGTNWFEIKPDEKQGNMSSGQYNIKTTNTYSDINAYTYFRVRVTGTSKQSYTDSEECNFGDIKLSVLLQDENLAIEMPSTMQLTMQQVRELHYANENQRMIFFHKDFVPHELRQAIQPLTVQGLDFSSLGNPTFGCFYQERLGIGGFTKANRQFNLSKSNPKDNVAFNFNLPTSTVVATDAMEFVIRRAKYPLREVLSGRNMIYLQCIDGLATISSGGDEVPLTPVQVAADLRNKTPFSDIPAVYQEELAFLVGSDYKTVYGMDYDYNVMRVRTIPINEHCLSYFESGIAQMITMKGQLPYIVFRLNNGKLLVATAYRTNAGFNFHLYPLKLADGTVECIGTLMNNQTGFDTLFAIIKHSNNVYTLESLESQLELYTAVRGRQYFLDNLMLDYQDKIEISRLDNIVFTYNGTISNSGRYLFSLQSKVSQMKYVWSYDNVQSSQTDDVYTLVENVVAGTPIYDSATNEQIAVANGGNSEQIAWQQTQIPGSSITVGVVAYRASQFDNEGTFMQDGGSIDLPDGEIKLTFANEITGTQDIICKTCRFDEQGMWAEVSDTPPMESTIGYSIPQKTFPLSLYQNLPAVLFDGDDVVEKESEDNDGNITFKRPVYKATVGLIYKAYAQFENIADASVASYEKVITNIAASITYGTGIKLGTESVVEPVGFANYPFSKWQDRILPDENMRNIPLADTGRKDKTIVLECDYPFPANITFITYDIKTTGVR